MSTKVFNPHRHSIPRVPFSTIARAILGTRYALSVIFIDSRTSRRLNKTYRGIDQPTDILSFSLDTRAGEVYISTAMTRKKARAFGMTYDTYLPYLFIHGVLHLKGYAHGRTMKRLERTHCRTFSIPHPD